MNTGVWITFVSLPHGKILPTGSGLGEAVKGEPHSHWAHAIKVQIPRVHAQRSTWRLRGEHYAWKNINWNGSPRRKKNKAAWYVLSEMSFSHQPWGSIHQRWPVKVMLADAQGSVSLTPSNHHSTYRSKCCTFPRGSGVNLTLLHRAGNSWNTSSFHPRSTSKQAPYGALTATDPG